MPQLAALPTLMHRGLVQWLAKMRYHRHFRPNGMSAKHTPVGPVWGRMREKYPQILYVGARSTFSGET